MHTCISNNYQKIMFAVLITILLLHCYYYNNLFITIITLLYSAVPYKTNPEPIPNDNPEPIPNDNPEPIPNDNPEPTPIDNLSPIHNSNLDDDETQIAALVNDTTIDDNFDMDDTFLANDTEINALISIHTIRDMDIDSPNHDEQNPNTTNTNEEVNIDGQNSDEHTNANYMDNPHETDPNLDDNNLQKTHKTTPTS